MRDTCPLKPTLHANTDVMQTMPVVLNSGLRVKVNPKICAITIATIIFLNKFKNVLQKGPETEKSLAYRQGLNPQLS